MNRLYYTSDDLSIETRITGIFGTANGHAVQLAETVLCPKGGGQLSDVGTIADTAVTNVVYGENDSILHLVDTVDGLEPGQSVGVAVDPTRRARNCRLHTAGHLIAQSAERLLPGSRAKQGHHWPGEARVEIELNGSEVGEIFIDELKTLVAELVAADLAVTRSDGTPPPRVVTIDGFAPLACGGTHVASLGALASVTLRNSKIKKGVLRIGYDI